MEEDTHVAVSPIATAGEHLEPVARPAWKSFWTWHGWQALGTIFAGAAFVAAAVYASFAHLQDEAVAELRKRGFRAYRLEDGYPEWRAAESLKLIGISTVFRT